MSTTTPDIAAGELLPCPFCGRTNAMTIHIRDGRKVACICGGCGKPEFNGRLDHPSAEARAISSWNRRSSPWQPIETAPKDGTPILAYGPLPGCNADEHGWRGVRETKWKCYPLGSPGYAAYERGEGPIGIGWDWYESVHNWSHVWKPTHWMTLPSAPSQIEEGKDAE